jgi:preprotein translocase subunit SecD
MSGTGYLRDKRILVLILIVLAMAALDLRYGIHFGIEFVGGTQIPITLEHTINVTAMSALITALQQRVSTFGLKQVTVEGVGDTHVYVTIPSATGSDINQTINILQSQGTFSGVVNGREAVNGTDILHGSIGEMPAQQFNSTVQWAVTFYVTQSSAQRFAQVVLGQANQPLYMFLDRPTSTLVLINASQLGNSTMNIGAAAALTAMQTALNFGNRTIPVVAVYSYNSSISSAESYLSSNKQYTQVIASKNLPATLLSFLKAGNYTVKLENAANMTPSFTKLTINSTVMQSWPAVGLLSAPVLSPSITNGNVSESYQISGYAPQSLSNAQKLVFANNQAKTIASILSGGALPVAIIAGTPTTIPPTLGQHFLYVSAIAGLLAVAAVSLFMVIRYRKLFLIAPILLTTFTELFIIVSIIGLIGTIDLSAVAGMIAVVGTGVDAQIIITDEMLSKKRETTSAKLLLDNAFSIIWADAILLVIAMLPLFFSTSLVTVIGFSESTIIGALLGVMITRPAYSAIISRHYA